ncbi:SemiSWEET transporter [Nanoarchaeota archaeon]
MEWIILIGLTAGILTTASFLPQVIKTIKLKETKDISLAMYSIISTGIFLWLVYGLLIKDLPVVLANAVSLILVLTMVGLKLKYG